MCLCIKRRSHGDARGFTLIEVMIVVAMIAILAAIALPSYRSYIQKSRAKAASADLVALSLAVENRFQKTLVYPTYASATTIAATPATRTDPVKTDFAAWIPSQGASFTYSIESTASTYTLRATGKDALSGCTLSLDQSNARNAASSCTTLGAW